MRKGTVRYENCIYKQKRRNVPFYDFSTSEPNERPKWELNTKRTGGKGELSSDNNKYSN